MSSYFYSLTSLPFFYKVSGKVTPWLTIMMLGCMVYGFVGALYLAPADYQQGEAFRIIYIHVPSAFLSLLIYGVMTIAASASLIARIKLADIIVAESAPLGAWFTFLALLTGALWGKPMWGTAWIWDARLTSELLLLFLYGGIIALRSASTSRDRASRAGNLLVLIGSLNLPIIHYSVYWWNTLHQGATLRLWGDSLIAPSMLHPLLAMIIGWICYYFTVLLLRVRCEILRREKRSQWVKTLVNVP